MDNFTPVFFITFPSFLAISIKIWLLINSDKRNLLINHWPLMLVFVGTGGTNIVEFLSFARLITPDLIALKLYYLSLILSFLGLFCLSVKNIIVSDIVDKLSISTAILLTLLLVGLILGTEWVITGYQLIDYSITRIAGPYYWLFQSFAVAALMISILLNLFGSLRQKPGCQKCKATLICFLPYAVSIILVILLMQAGIRINASLIVPLATTYLLLMLVYLEDKNMVFRILASVPFSKERKGYRLLAAEIEQFLGNAANGDKISLRVLTNALEKHIVSVAVEMSNGSQAKAADLLGTSKSSVCRKINS